MTQQSKNHLSLLLLSKFVAETPKDKINGDCEAKMVELAQQFEKNIIENCPEVATELGRYINNVGALNGLGMSLAMSKLNADNKKKGVNFEAMFANGTVGFSLAGIFEAGKQLERKFEDGTILSLTPEVGDELDKIIEMANNLKSVVGVQEAVVG